MHSFTLLEELFKEINNFAPNVPIVVWGNKSDLKTKRVITAEQGMLFAESHGAAFIESSSLRSTLIDEIFILMTAMIIQKEKH